METNPQIFNSSNRSLPLSEFTEPGQLLSGSSNVSTRLSLVNNATNLEANGLALLDEDLEIDSGFSDDVTSGVVMTIAEADVPLELIGDLVIGGTFTSVRGSTRNRIAKVDTSGNLDASFNPNANAAVHEVIYTSTEQIMAVGEFTTIGGLSRSRMARLDASTGAVDTSFISQANGTVQAVCELSDGGFAIGGTFTQISATGGQFTTVDRARFALLESDGEPLSEDISVDDSVEVIFQHSTGSIFVGGTFTQVTVNGFSDAKEAIFALEPIGFNLNTSFNGELYLTQPVEPPEGEIIVTPQVVPPSHFVGRVYAINEDPIDSQLIVGGDFSAISSYAVKTNIAKVDTDGFPDPAFSVALNGPVKSISIAPDGDYIISGEFSTVNNIVRRGIAKVNRTTGALDFSFNLVPSSPIVSTHKFANGPIAIGGSFSKDKLSDVSAGLDLGLSYPNTLGWKKPTAIPRPNPTYFVGLNSLSTTPGTYYVGENGVAIGSTPSIPIGSVYTFRARYTSSSYRLPYFYTTSGATLYTCLGARVGSITNTDYRFMLRTIDSVAHLVKISEAEWVLFGDIII